MNGGVLQIICTQSGRDGNSIELLSMWKTSGNTAVFPFGRPSMASGQTAKLTGGVDPTSMHFHLDFSALGLASCRQIWLTLAPGMTYDSTPPGYVEFAFSNSYGTGYSHSITIGSNTYSYTQVSTDTAASIASALAAAINAAEDANATASTLQRHCGPDGAHGQRRLGVLLSLGRQHGGDAAWKPGSVPWWPSRRKSSRRSSRTGPSLIRAA